MAFIPFAATIGAALGGSATLGGLAIAAGAATAGASIYANSQASKASKEANRQADVQNKAAMAGLNQAQANASTKAADTLQAKQRARAGSQSIYTSPLGLTEQASTAKKKLLGE